MHIVAGKRQPEPNDLPDALRESLETLLQRIYNETAKRELWANRFTATDRRKFPAGDAALRKHNIIELCHLARGTATWNECIVEVAHALGFINDVRRATLLEALGAKPSQTKGGGRSSAVPHWDDDARELRYGGKVVRVVRRPRQAHNIVAILRAFEAAGWPARIDDPHHRKANDETRRRDMSNLNKGLDTTLLRFACDGNGTGFLWQRVKQPKAAKPAARPRK
jgi:hypothetical protein